MGFDPSCSESNTTLQLNIVEQKEGIPPVQQRLVFDGKILLDNKSVQDYTITDGAIIHLVLALKGGI